MTADRQVGAGRFGARPFADDRRGGAHYDTHLRRGPGVHRRWPGLRFVLFTQGCPHHCPGCHNPESHDPAGGYDIAWEKVYAEFEKNPLLKGLTLSGGEPMLQPAELVDLCRAVHAAGKDVMAYTGFTYEELLDRQKDDPALAELLNEIDTLVDGRFILAQRDLTLIYKGSRNQRIIDLNATRREGHLVPRSHRGGKCPPGAVSHSLCPPSPDGGQFCSQKATGFFPPPAL